MPAKTLFLIALLSTTLNVVAHPTLLLLEGTVFVASGKTYDGLFVTRIYSDDLKTNLVYSAEVMVEKGVFNELLGGDKPIYLSKEKYYLNLLIGLECSQEKITNCNEIDLSEGESVLAEFEVK